MNKNLKHQLVLLATLAAGLCLASVYEQGQTAPAATAAAVPVATLGSGDELACRAFAPLSLDADHGILTNEEFREGLKRVYQLADTGSPVARASEALLRTFTVGTDGGVPGATARQQFLALAEACTPVLKRAS